MRILLCSLVVASALVPGSLVHAQSQEAGRPSAEDLTAAYLAFITGRSLEAAGDVEAAAASHRRAAALDPASPDIWAELAGLYARANRPEEAVEAAEAALGQDPENTEAHRILGLVYAARAGSRGGDAEDLSRAVEHLERARNPVSPDLALYLTLGRLYLGSQNPTKARELLDEVLEAEPQFAEALALLAQAYEAEGQWADAAAVYERAILAGPRRARYRRELAAALLNADQPDRALEVLRELVRFRPDDAGGWFSLSNLELQLGNPDGAVAAARRVMELEPEGLRGPYILSRALGFQGRYREMIDTLGPVLERARGENVAPNQIVSLLQSLSGAHVQLGDYDAAIENLAAALELAPSDLGIQAQLAQAYLSAGRFDAAEDVVARAKRDRPDNLALLRLEAQALSARGEFGEAATVLEGALERHRTEPIAHVALANLYSEVDRVDDAVQVLTVAETQFPDNTLIVFQLGAVFDRAGRYVEAEVAFRRVLDQNPEDAQTLNYLGYMLAERGERLDESVSLILRALEVDPNNGSYLDSLGWAYFKQDRFELAEPPLRRAGDQLQGNSVVQDHLGDLLYKIERYAEAVVVWERALAGDRDGVDLLEIERKLSDARERLVR